MDEGKMIRGRGMTALLAVLVALGVAVWAITGGDSGSGSVKAGDAGSINGAGATFPEPIYVEWAGAYHEANGDVRVNYQGVGSGGGIDQFTQRTVDFGATDAPMTDEQLAAATGVGGEVLHVPTVLGAVVIAYNLPGVDSLRLDGSTLAAIYLGDITTWDDTAIAKLNPGADLPSTDIAVVHRGDDSGTSYVFTGYLSSVDEGWRSGPGQSKKPEWPLGTGGQGNDGVAAAIKQQQGAVGYVEIAYAQQNDLAFADLRNLRGEFVSPSLESTTAAGQGADIPDDLRFSLIDSPAVGAYPIVSATWQLVWKDAVEANVPVERAKALQQFLRWELGAGQRLAPEAGYAPLPVALRDKALAAVNSMQVDGR